MPRVGSGISADKRAVRIVYFQLMVNIVHSGCDELVAYQAGSIDDVCRIRVLRSAISRRRARGIDGNDAAARGVEVGEEIEYRADIAYGFVSGVGFVEELMNGCGANRRGDNRCGSSGQCRDRRRATGICRLP